MKNKSIVLNGGIGMLLSIISSSAISSSVISMVTTPGLTQYGAMVVGGLIILLSLREILSASDYWNKSLNSSFNMAIAPLFICFLAIVLFQLVAFTA